MSPFFLLLVGLMACGGTEAPESASASAPSTAATPSIAEPEATATENEPRLTVNKRYRISWRTEPSPLPLSTLFEIEARVTDAAGAPMEGGAVRIDARMPQHGHGMATRPEDDPGVCDEAGVCTHPGGLHRTRGMKFHMPGEWTVRFDVEGPAGIDHLEVPIRI